MRIRFAWKTALLLGAAFGMGRPGNARAAAEAVKSVRLPCVRDVWVSGYGKEKTNSMGKTPKLKCKSVEEFSLFDFDWSKLKGKRIASAGAWLYLRALPAEKGMARLKLEHLLKPLKGIPFHWMGVSTVSSPWEEGRQAKSYQDDPEGHGACFVEASSGKDPWAWPGSFLWDVVQGNGNSVGSRVEVERLDDRWFRVPVKKAIIENLLAGGGYGLLLSEDTFPKGKYGLDAFIHSRESKGSEPYLAVALDGEDREAPAAPEAPRIEAAPAEATLTHGAVKVSLTLSGNAAAFHVFVKGERLEPWRVARPARLKRNGGPQSFFLRDLPANQKLTFRLAVADGSGNVSKAVTLKAQSSPALSPPPKLPASAFHPKGGEPPLRAGKLKVWAAPEGVQTDPLQGAVLFEGAGFRKANPVWDGAAGLVRLAAARAELTGFQLLFEKAGEEAVEGIEVKLGVLKGPGGAKLDAADHARLFRTWYLKPKNVYLGEYAIPLEGPLAVPFAANKVPGQKQQGLLVDLHVPRETAAGTYEGPITIRAKDVPPFHLKLRIEVFNTVIPDTLSFNPELNSYGAPNRQPPGSPYFKAAYRLAHYHRCTVNALPYSQSGHIRADWAPPVAGGKVSDWSNFDAKFGPLLDGTLFKDLPRAGVPIKTFYLGFEEAWPFNYQKDFGWKKFGRDAATVIEYRLLGPGPEKGIGAGYRKQFASVVASFVKHFEKKGWTKTDAQFYLNNKFEASGRIFWHLDEPASQPDYAALRAWGKIWKEGVKGQKTARLKYRGDISRPMWMFGQLDGLMDIVYVQSSVFGYPRTLQAMKRRHPYQWYVYGSCSAPGRHNLETAAWCLKAYAAGADGVLPWRATKGTNFFGKGHIDALLVPGDQAGHAGPVVSLRVFALRQGAQDVELLRRLAAKKGWTREQAATLIGQRIPLQASSNGASPEAAAAVTFQRLSARGFAELKEGVLRLLSSAP